MDGATAVRTDFAETSVQEVRAIQGVPLFRDEARVADHAPQLFFGRLMMRARRRHHVLFDHDAAHIVTAEAEAELADLESGCYPRALDVFNVVQIDSGNRQCLEILDRSGFL